MKSLNPAPLGGVEPLDRFEELLDDETDKMYYLEAITRKKDEERTARQRKKQKYSIVYMFISYIYRYRYTCIRLYIYIIYSQTSGPAENGASCGEEYEDGRFGSVLYMHSCSLSYFCVVILSSSSSLDVDSPCLPRTRTR